jgi:integrase/recombinase XerD
MKIAKYAEKAGLNGFHTHSLRHKFATDLLEHNVNLKIVQELLGHESLETTQAYLSITDETKRKAIDSLEGPKPEEAYIDDVGAGIYPFVYEPKDKGS